MFLSPLKKTWFENWKQPYFLFIVSKWRLCMNLGQMIMIFEFCWGYIFIWQMLTMEQHIKYSNHVVILFKKITLTWGFFVSLGQCFSWSVDFSCLTLGPHLWIFLTIINQFTALGGGRKWLKVKGFCEINDPIILMDPLKSTFNGGDTLSCSFYIANFKRAG